jgi:hypothetical protein
VRHQIPAAAPLKRTLRLSELSAPRQALVRLCQSIDYGQILDLQVCDCEPVFSPPPTVLLDIKLDTDSGGRPESELADFALCDEVCRLLDRLDQMQTGQIQRIEVRAGIARRVLIQTKLTEAPQ